MTQAVNLAALARRVTSGDIIPPSAIATLSASLSATGTDLIINGLEADTVYEGSLMMFPALDGAVGWQSRTTSGGAWNEGASDYNSQVFVGFATSSSIVATNNAHGQMGTVDAGTTHTPALFHFLLYTGTASRRATVSTHGSYITTDGTSMVTGSLFSRRAANGIIADIRFLNVTAASGLGAGSRVILQRLI